MEQDVLDASGQLAGLGSESAAIITGLKLRRAVVREALSPFSGDRSTQVALACILSSVRFSCSKGPETRSGSVDSYQHLVRCYRRLSRVCEGSDAIEWSSPMARRPKKPSPGISMPVECCRSKTHRVTHTTEARRCCPRFLLQIQTGRKPIIMASIRR